ncbi:TPA: hypothetical protein U5E25_003139 [Yersinia enterocolitica]|nr:hypothetical protein [Yersinia enterocolitica]
MSSSITHYRNGVPYNAAGEVVITITGGPEQLNDTVSNNTSQRFGSISDSPHRSFPSGSLYRPRRRNDYNPDSFGQSIFEYLDYLDDLSGTASSEETENKELDEKLKNDTKLLAEVIRDITRKHSDELGKIAGKLSQNIKGRKIRNYQDAIASMEKFQNGRYFKLAQDDRNALADAVKAMDKRTLADNLGRLSAASGLLAKGFIVEVFFSKIEEGFRTGNWKPLMLEIEAMALSGVAAAAMTRYIPYIVLGLAAHVPMLFPPADAYALAIFGIAILASLIDAELVDKFNNEIEDLYDALRTDY